MSSNLTQWDFYLQDYNLEPGYWIYCGFSSLQYYCGNNIKIATASHKFRYRLPPDK